MKTDIQIAQDAKMLPIADIAADLGVAEEELELYGRYKAKITDAFLKRAESKKNGKLIQKGTYAKMLRGEMVYWMAENGITDTHGLKEFSDGAVYSEEDSDEENYVFIRTERKQR